MLAITWQALLLQIVGFLLLVAVLKKFLFGPISGILEARQNEVQDTLDRIHVAWQGSRRRRAIASRPPSTMPRV
jgi:F0F1-type ATP synthase membrane subunit b/b'